ncbi:PaaI family thioesterase [Desulfobulbus sp.]|uniref:PaaI family thioesterase n=1 Tax=Desulfobulbus sp. TaxID=895 RepID=UPI00286EE0D0|nr:PaaI family thioesterase [Desulfobulbus sp.]
MSELAFQDQYPDDYAHCYGCGRLNPQGHHLKSYWDGEETVCRFTPDPKYTGGFPGFLYGGMIASLIDCHGAGTAAAAKAREEGKPISRFVTASLKVDYLAPTPINTELEVRGKVVEIKGRKVTVELSLAAAGTLCAKGSVLYIQIKGQE